MAEQQAEEGKQLLLMKGGHDPVYVPHISEINPKTGLVVRFSSRSITSQLASQSSSSLPEPLVDKRKRKKGDRSDVDKEESGKQKKSKKPT